MDTPEILLEASATEPAAVDLSMIEDLLDMVNGLFLVDIFQFALLVLLAGLVFGAIAVSRWR